VSRKAKLQVGEVKLAPPMAERAAGASVRASEALGRREMNVAVLKTKAEQALTETFATIADKLPGGPAVLKRRNEAIGRFSALGLPHRRIEAWKYTDLRSLMKEALPPSLAVSVSVTAEALDAALGPLATLDATRIVFVDGFYAEALSDARKVKGLAVMSLRNAFANEGYTTSDELLELKGVANEPIVALNTAYVTDGAVIGIAENVALEKPLLILNVSASAEPRLVATRTIVAVGAGADVHVIEAFVTLPGAASEAQASALTEIDLAKGARVSHVKCLLGAVRTTHLANWLVSIGQKADYRGFQFTSGVALARNQLAVTFRGEGAKVDLSGVFLGLGHQHVDTTLVVDHAVPGCTSRELFKGVLADEARGIFQGKVIVRPDAQKSDGKQMAQVLMLSPNAEFDSKPELEIYADDVICGHGSTSADLDEDMLFYCRSRGIPEHEARALLIESFIGEAIAKVEREDVREALAALARAWLDDLPPAARA
jgi:Fe-S cluster assembly protein SufD